MNQQIEHEVLLDVRKHPGSSRDQVRYRLVDHSPLSVNTTIEILIAAGYLVYHPPGKLEITAMGMATIIPVREGVSV